MSNRYMSNNFSKSVRSYGTLQKVHFVDHPTLRMGPQIFHIHNNNNYYRLVGLIHS